MLSVAGMGGTGKWQSARCGENKVLGGGTKIWYQVPPRRSDGRVGIFGFRPIGIGQTSGNGKGDFGTGSSKAVSRSCGSEGMTRPIHPQSLHPNQDLFPLSF